MTSNEHTHEPAVVVQSAIGGTVTDICECGAQRDVVGALPRAWVPPVAPERVEVQLPRFLATLAVDSTQRHLGRLLESFCADELAHASIAFYRRTVSGSPFALTADEAPAVLAVLACVRGDAERATCAVSKMMTAPILDACDAAIAKISQLTVAKC